MTIRRLLLWIVGLGLGLGTLVVVADLWVLPWIIHHQSEVLVPELVGTPREEATERAESLGLGLLVIEELHDEDAPPGTVLEQTPTPMRPVRRGREIRVVVSKGEAQIRVPDLTGLSLRQSELQLLRAGLRVGRVARSFDPTGPAGVVAQRPHPGTEVLQDHPVHLMVRAGVERSHFRMPSLVGDNLTEVRRRLDDAGFEIRRVTSRPAEDTEPGTVLDQWPPAGSRIARGGSIELVASSPR